MPDRRSQAKTGAIVVGILVAGFYGSFYLLPVGWHPCDDMSQVYVGASFDVTAQGDGDLRISHQGGKTINSSNTDRLYLYLEDAEMDKTAEYTWWNESAPRGVKSVARNDTLVVNYGQIMDETLTPDDRALLYWVGPGEAKPAVCPTNYDTERAPLAGL